jgi:hypothetical protein
VFFKHVVYWFPFWQPKAAYRNHYTIGNAGPSISR